MFKVIPSLDNFHFSEFVGCYRWTKCQDIHCKKSRDGFIGIVNPIRFLSDADQFIESGWTGKGILNAGLAVHEL
jgi:hypothetical protein